MESNRKKKILMMISLSLFSITIISLGTYALWTSTNDLLTGSNTIQSGQVKMSYTETNEIGMNNALPIKDSEGKTLTNYFDFQVLSYIKTRANDDTQRKLNYNIVLEPITVDNPLSDSEIKVYLTKVVDGTETVVVEPTTIDKLNQYVLKSQEEIFSNNKAEVTTSYRLRAWIDENVDANKLSEKSYSYRFRININNEKIAEIVPLLNIPVGTNGIEKVEHEIDDTLQVDSRFATEYRYRGGNVANYVTFNNEVWRIIGVIPTEDTNGNVENRVKIVRNVEITSDEKGDWIDDADEVSAWTNDTLNAYLNNDYYNTLTNDAKSMIGTTKYYLGGYDNKNVTSSMMWKYERKKSNDDSGTYFFGSVPIMQNDESKKIAIMYLSDYGYAVSKNCTNNLSNYRDDALCNSTNNWLNEFNELLTITPGDGSEFPFRVSNGYIGADAIYSTDYKVHPVLTLSSNVKISGGSGTSSDPYTLSVN